MFFYICAFVNFNTKTLKPLLFPFILMFQFLQIDIDCYPAFSRNPPQNQDTMLLFARYLRD